MWDRELDREYARLRGLGWKASEALRSARVNVAWDRAERAGRVRLDVRPDEEPDLSYLQQECFSRVMAAEIKRANHEGVWGICGVSIGPDGSETEHDSCWGFTGEDWRDSGYDVDIKRAVLEAIAPTPSCWEAL